MSTNYPIFDEIYEKYPDQMYQIILLPNGEPRVTPGLLFVEDPFTGSLEIHVPVGSPFQESPVLVADLATIASRYQVEVKNKIRNRFLPEKKVDDEKSPVKKK